MPSASVAVALAMLGCVTGCSTSPRADDATGNDLNASSITSTRFVDDVGGRAVLASALVFDPPVTLGEPQINLSRAGREPAAFFGYEEGMTEYYRLTVDDRQIGYGGHGHGGWGRSGGHSGWHDRYERRAVSEKTGIIHR